MNEYEALLNSYRAVVWSNMGGHLNTKIGANRVITLALFYATLQRATGREENRPDTIPKSNLPADAAPFESNADDLCVNKQVQTISH